MGENKSVYVELIKKISLLLAAAEPFPDSNIKMSVDKIIDVDYGIELIAEILKRDIVSKIESYGAYKALLKRVTYMGVTFEQREPVKLEDDNNV
jgi:hypothetical protein